MQVPDEHTVHLHSHGGILERCSIFLHTCDSVTGVGGEKVENVSFEICRHPCDEVTGLITEIQDLRIVTNNLLEDLDRVVRNNVHVLSACWLLHVLLLTFKMKKETKHV